MSADAPNPLDYETRAAATRPRAHAGWAVLGTAAAVSVTPACAFAGAWLDGTLNSESDYAGLAGLIYGGIVGLAAQLAALVWGVLLATRGRDGRRRGLGLGLLIGTGLAALGVGACLVGVNV